MQVTGSTSMTLYNLMVVFIIADMQDPRKKCIFQFLKLTEVCKPVCILYYLATGTFCASIIYFCTFSLNNQLRTHKVM